MCLQVERLEVINKQYVRVVLVPGADTDRVRSRLCVTLTPKMAAL